MRTTFPEPSDPGGGRRDKMARALVFRAAACSRPIPKSSTLVLTQNLQGSPGCCFVQVCGAPSNSPKVRGSSSTLAAPHYHGPTPLTLSKTQLIL